MKLTKKKAVGVCIVVAALAAGGYYIKAKDGAKEAAGAMVTTSTVARKDIEESIQLKAPLEGTESVELVSKLHYEVIQLNVKEGDKVTKGQVLAVLDSSTLEKEIAKLEDDISVSKVSLNDTISRAEEEKTLAAYQLEDRLKTAQYEYESALIVLQDAKRQYDNTKTLFDSGIETKENLKLKELALTEAQKKVDDFNVQDGKVVATNAELKAIENAGMTNAASERKRIEAEQKSLARKREDLKDCQIISTIDGTVTRVNIKLGRFADETDNDKPMFVIENIDSLQMKVMVSEYDIGKIKVDQEVEITADILKGQIAKGVVSRISPTGEEKSNSTERVIPTQVDITENAQGLIAGINATAKIIIAKQKDVLLVPIESLVENADGTSQVYRVNSENKVEIVLVTPGLENDLEIEIKGEQLKEGDNVILAPTPDLVEGALVMPMGV